MFSENHYGIYTWTGTPKFFATTVGNPLLSPFTILSIVPSNPAQYAQPQTSLRVLPFDTSYSYQVIHGSTPGMTVNVPWYWGSNAWKDGTLANGRICWLPNPDILLSEGDTVVISSASYSSGVPITSPITLATTDGISVYYVDPANQGQTGSNLTQLTNEYGSSWKLWLSFPWAHGGDSNQRDFPRLVPADWWAK
jgi:hypothetical protein